MSKPHAPSAAPAASADMRLDKWLWAARFYKTRTAATEAVHGGKVDVNGEHARPARAVRIGDTLRIRQPPFDYIVTITALGVRRGSAAQAAALYQENEASIATRERIREQLRYAPQVEFSEGRPDKKARRAIRQWRGDK